MYPAQPRDPTMVGGQEATGKSQSAEASSMMLRVLALVVRRQAAPLKSPATKSTFTSSVTARMVDSNLLPMPRFLVF